MTKGRLEAFSDGVIAIIITIMVLELRAPHGVSFSDLHPLWPVLTSYVLSYVNLGIYWNNHHHMLHATRRVSGAVLWANLHLLFWLSLFPFGTSWMGDSHFAPMPMAFYGFILLMAGLSYYMLQGAILRTEGPDSLLARAIGDDFKGKFSIIAYLVAIPSAFVSPWIAGALYTAVALMWLIPDRRIERVLDGPPAGTGD
jgi:uncharacterized membrane protein